MACMEARRALKSSFLSEISCGQDQNMSYLDYDDVINVGGVVGGEDFLVEELLDFSNGEFQEQEVEEEGGSAVEEEEEEEEEEKDSTATTTTATTTTTTCVTSQEYFVDDDDNSNYSSSFSSNLDSHTLLDTELAVPMDHMEELEWVSLMVEDTMPDSLLCPVFGKGKAENCVKTGCESVFPSRIPVKSRTKRPRNSRFGKQQLLMSPPSESSSTSSCSSGHSSVSCLTVTNSMVPRMTGPSEPEKKKKKKPNPVIQASAFQFQRRCSHCGVQKTPQWRTGPFGPKTLCNACGVRYKSGRLFPEYRPACSPTYSVELHSNSHRKVLEMRKKKEMVGTMMSDSNQVVPIF